MLNLVLEVKRITKQQTVLKFSEVIKIAQLHGVLHEIMTEKKKKKQPMCYDVQISTELT